MPVLVKTASLHTDEKGVQQYTPSRKALTVKQLKGLLIGVSEDTTVIVSVPVLDLQLDKVTHYEEMHLTETYHDPEAKEIYLIGENVT